MRRTHGLPRAHALLALASVMCFALPAWAQDHADHHGHHPHHPAAPERPPVTAPLTPIPALDAADRAAAFPPTHGHTTHDNRVHHFVVLDRLEAVDSDDGRVLSWEADGWLGTDLDRLWLRSEGDYVEGELESGDVEVLYGRAVSRWWEAVVGIRHDSGEYPSQTLAAVGVMGLAPYMFEVEATAYLGTGGQAGLAVEAEHETLFTNRLILQSSVEAEAWSRDDARRGTGSGLGTVEAGLRLRYEFTRRFAPYVGVAWERAHGRTADMRRAAGHDTGDARLVLGLRTWF
jgi:copper resistance protein B